MARYKNSHTIDPSERQILIYNNGLLGNAPPFLMESSAELLGSELISGHQIRRTLFNKRLQRGIPYWQAVKVQPKTVKRHIAQQARTLLGQEADVVIDAHYNTPEKRHYLQRVAWAAGAATVALKVYAPRDLAISRVEEWVERVKVEESPVSLDLSDRNHPLHIARTMKSMANIVVHPGEADYILPIDGEGDTAQVLRQIEDQFIRHGLIALED